jgi:trehalose synthase
MNLRPAEVSVPVQPVSRFAEVLDAGDYARFRAAIDGAVDLLGGRVVWNVNSTARGGGVAEMMGPLIGGARDAGADARWLVVEGDAAFFRVTKRLHNMLHSEPGDGGELGAPERRDYERVLRDNAVELQALVRPGDVVVLHDPQTAGLAPMLRRAGCIVAWRCHIGHEALDHPLVRAAWEFLERYLRAAHVTVFSRPAYVPACCADRARIIRPAIDPFSPKNQDLPPATARAILVHAGLVEGPDGGPPVFRRDDGSPGRVDRGADIVRAGRAPDCEAPLVVQISRWDRLKDHIGVMHGFARLSAAEVGDARLVLAGPSARGVTDDPEGPEVLTELIRAWRELPHERRHRVQIASLPMIDPSENAAMVNALQRHASVVVQKSLQEGFGLTVTEAMWKGRPVVAGAVGGIPDQVRPGRDGVLLDEPGDLGAFAGAVAGLLADPERADDLGRSAHERVRHEFLGMRQLADYAELMAELVA